MDMSLLLPTEQVEKLRIQEHWRSCVLQGEHKPRKLGNFSGLQPSGRDEELVVALSPVTDKMHMGNSVPSYGPCVFSDYYLKLSRHHIEEVRQRAEYPTHTINIR